ncbi:MAG: DUF6290 family protein [Candidatus Ancillula sp.]|jgi:predicted DNA-binding protein|nr:DUF6290 family protein [Candidatus Ancillula sp.]
MQTQTSKLKSQVVSFRIDKEEQDALNNISSFYGVKPTLFAKQLMIDRLEEIEDIIIAERVRKSDEKRYSFEEVAEEFGIEL